MSFVLFLKMYRITQHIMKSIITLFRNRIISFINGIKTAILSITVLLLVPNIGSGQSADTNTWYPPENLKQIFYAHFPYHHRKKIRGRIYRNPYPDAEKHQFYGSKSTREAILFTGGDTVFCKNIFFETHADRIIVYEKDLNGFLELDAEAIERFILLDSEGCRREEFIRGDFGLSEYGMNREGFYKVLFDGEFYSLFKKYYKIQTEVEERGRFRVGFIEIERFVVRIDSSYSVIRKNRDLLVHFPEDAKTIKRYMRQNRIHIRSARDNQAISVIQYIEEMHKNPHALMLQE